MKEKRLRQATFAALVIVMLANVVAALANWQVFAARQQTQDALAKWRQSASTLAQRIEALEVSQLAMRPPRQQLQQ